jgi:hypothetical protein
MEKKAPLSIVDKNIKGKPLWVVPYNWAVLLLDIYPKESKASFQRDVCIPMFIEVLFTIAKTWKQPMSLTNKSISKMYAYHTNTYTRRNIISS